MVAITVHGDTRGCESVSHRRFTPSRHPVLSSSYLSPFNDNNGFLQEDETFQETAA